ncbi:TatD family hydrolase [Mobilitalea sibirica]|uniref:TatD family hydrolase n=1 Tax=Mobilitalea sibirica TaxID=1462919 RepID=A0A8J7H5W5_9FIRM|nr:TatD family hydrolase [Mobilitalea sibirica]MBH1941909.1 TatD family hydrolase [Mobilitalea sibirica]
MIFETHAHYEDEAFDIDREELLDRLPKEGIEYVVNVSSGIETVDKITQLMDKYSYIYGAIGIHPGSSMDLDEERFHWLREKAKHPKNLAIGEIGLDYYWDTPDRKTQKNWFVRQMEMAKELELPLVIHSRDAANDTFGMMKEAKAEAMGAIIHCFGYGVEQAKQYLNMGFYLGIGGVITFTNGRKLKEVVEYAPLEQLVLETDCPYLAPVPHRGKRNNSLYLTYIAKEIARIKNMDYETVVKVTSDNAKRFYRL